MSHPTSREGLMNGMHKLYVQPPLELHVKALSHCTVSLVPRLLFTKQKKVW